MSVHIDCPEAPGDRHCVVPVTGFAAGIICSHGEAYRVAGARGKKKKRDPERRNEVRAWVFQNFDPVGNETPPAHANHIPVSDDDTWRDEAIGGAVCSDTGEANTLATWFEYFDPISNSMQVQGPYTRPFIGIRADNVWCCEGSGNPCEGNDTVSAGSGEALTMAPRVWKLRPTGFTGARVVFNRTWTLKLRSPKGGFSIWSNGGDGREKPHVELRCESPLLKTWRLTLKHKTKLVVYHRRARDWNSLGENVLRREGGTAKMGPDQLIVIPG